jgi:tetratricopeptide (TPR) repeat protein
MSYLLPYNQKSPDELYQFLVNIPTSEIDPEQILEYMGVLIDLSFDLRKKEGLELAIHWGNQIGQRGANKINRSLFHYFCANAWFCLKNVLVHVEGKQENWAWEQTETEKEIFHLRAALIEPAFVELEPFRQCQILTNLANTYDTIGRFVEAQEYWGRALVINPRFGMALGNRGLGLWHYAFSLYDSGHATIFLKSALNDLNHSLEIPADDPFAKKIYLGKRNKILSSFPKLATEEFNLSDFSLGSSENEIQYREWCLRNCLFLNPLNDLGALPIAARDIFSLPDIVYKLEDGPYFHGFFDQLKQEFVSARYLFYQGTTIHEAHFSDKGVLLYNTLDYPIYSLAIERAKGAYRTAYSIFDKIAYFLNEYLQLGIPEKSVNFRSLWYQETKKQLGLRQDMAQRQNWGLRGLFWLSKDLFEAKGGFKDTTEPDARSLAEIRNHLEHKYLKIHDEMWWGIDEQKDGNLKSGVFKYPIGYSLHRNDFHAKTLRLLKLTRAAMIYLSLGIHQEERIKQGSGVNLPMFMDTYDDDWKT